MDFEKIQSSPLAIVMPILKAIIFANLANEESGRNDNFLLRESLMPKREVQLPDRPFSVANRRYLPFALVKPISFFGSIFDNQLNQFPDSDEIDESEILNSLL